MTARWTCTGPTAARSDYARYPNDGGGMASERPDPRPTFVVFSHVRQCVLIWYRLRWKCVLRLVFGAGLLMLLAGLMLLIVILVTQGMAQAVIWVLALGTGGHRRCACHSRDVVVEAVHRCLTAGQIESVARAAEELQAAGAGALT